MNENSISSNFPLNGPLVATNSNSWTNLVISRYARGASSQSTLRNFNPRFWAACKPAEINAFGLISIMSLSPGSTAFLISRPVWSHTRVLPIVTGVFTGKLKENVNSFLSF